MKCMSHPEMGCEQVRQRLFDLFDVVNVMAAHERPAENVYSIKVVKSRTTTGSQDENDDAMANVFYGDGHGRERKCCGCAADAYHGQRGGVVQSIEVDGSSGGVQSDYREGAQKRRSLAEPGGVLAAGAQARRGCGGI